MSDLSTTTTFGAGDSHGFTVRDRIQNERAFRRARRHSRVVRVLRVAAPAGLAALVCGLALVAWFDPLRALKSLPVSIENVIVSGTKVTMAAPKLSGFTNDARRYDLSARAATQDVTKPDILELEDISAKFEAPDKTQIDLTASDGTYDRKNGTLLLRRNVLLVTSNGYKARLNEVQVNTANGDIVSNVPVQIDMLQGTLKAKRLEVLKTGEIINFDGGVSLTVLPDQLPEQGTPNKPDKQ